MLYYGFIQQEGAVTYATLSNAIRERYGIVPELVPPSMGEEHPQYEFIFGIRYERDNLETAISLIRELGFEVESIEGLDERANI